MLQQYWLFIVAQRPMWDGSLQSESSLVFIWGSVPGGPGSTAGMIVLLPLWFLGASKSMSLAAHVKAEPPALENLVSPA